MKHQKHKQLIRPDWGQWGRNEWAIVGGKCSDIQSLSNTIIKNLTQYRSLYIDADHQLHDDKESLPFDTLTDKIGYYEWASADEPNKFTTRPQLVNYGLILVNGNHHQARKQIVIIDSDKEKSLKKRIDQLTDVDLLVFHENRNGVAFDFLDAHLKATDQNPERIDLNDVDKLTAFIKSGISTPPLKALLLVGGKSTRMGEDKAQIDYHGKPQFAYVHDLLKKHINEVYISCRKDQEEQYDGYETLPDTFDDLGPFGGMLSAFRTDPNVAWLVIACDLPMVSEETIVQLIQERNPSAAGTAFHSTHSKWMEPLISIYEPSIYPTALLLLGQGYSCARKVMINAPTHLIHARNTEWLTNVNTPEDKSKIH